MRRSHRWLSRLDGGTKLLGVLVFGGSAMIDGTGLLGYGLTVLLLGLALDNQMGRSFLKVIVSILPMAVMVVAIQGFFYKGNQQVLWQLGALSFCLEGLLKGINLIGTVMVFLGSFYLLLTTTETSQLVASLRRIGLPTKVAYVLLAILSVVPQMQERVKKIRAAQSSRGLPVEGGIRQRLGAFIPLLTPLIMLSLLDSQERGMTLEMRGLNLRGKKTSYLESVPTKEDRLIVWGLFLFFLSVTGYRVFRRVVS